MVIPKRLNVIVILCYNLMIAVQQGLFQKPLE